MGVFKEEMGKTEWRYLNDFLSRKILSFGDMFREASTVVVCVSVSVCMCVCVCGVHVFVHLLRVPLLTFLFLCVHRVFFFFLFFLSFCSWCI